MDKHTIEFYRRFFLQKTNKKCKENQGRNALYISEYDVTYTEFKAL